MDKSYLSWKALFPHNWPTLSSLLIPNSQRLRLSNHGRDHSHKELYRMKLRVCLHRYHDDRYTVQRYLIDISSKLFLVFLFKLQENSFRTVTSPDEPLRGTIVSGLSIQFEMKNGS